MSISFSSANANQALILETFGLPTLARKGKLYTPVPCCQDVKVFKTGRSDFTFETKQFGTTDCQEIFVIASVSYSIDDTTRSGILKAYKSLVKPSKKFHNSFKSPFKQHEALEIGAEAGIKDIVSNLIVDKMKVMTLQEVISIDLVFIDEVFEKAKSLLKEFFVQLKSIKIKEVVQINRKVDALCIESNEPEPEPEPEAEPEPEGYVCGDEVAPVEDVCEVETVDVVESEPPVVECDNREEEELIEVEITTEVESEPPIIECDNMEDEIQIELIDEVESAPTFFECEDIEEEKETIDVAGESDHEEDATEETVDEVTQSACENCPICSSVDDIIDEDTESFSYVIKVIPEESKISKLRRVTTTEVVLDGSLVTQTTAHVHTSISAEVVVHEVEHEHEEDAYDAESESHSSNEDDTLSSDVHMEIGQNIIHVDGDEDHEHHVDIPDTPDVPEIPDVPECTAVEVDDVECTPQDCAIPDVPECTAVVVGDVECTPQDCAIPDVPECTTVVVGDVECTPHDCTIPDDPECRAVEVDDVECTPTDCTMPDVPECTTVEVGDVECTPPDCTIPDTTIEIHATTTQVVIDEGEDPHSTNVTLVVDCEMDQEDEIKALEVADVECTPWDDITPDISFDVQTITTEIVIHKDGDEFVTNVEALTYDVVADDGVEGSTDDVHDDVHVEIHAHTTNTITTEIVTTNEDGELISSQVLTEADEECQTEAVVMGDEVDVISRELEERFNHLMETGEIGDHCHDDDDVTITQTVETTKFVVGHDGTPILMDVHVETVKEDGDDFSEAIVSHAHFHEDGVASVTTEVVVEKDGEVVSTDIIFGEVHLDIDTGIIPSISCGDATAEIVVDEDHLSMIDIVPGFSFNN